MFQPTLPLRGATEGFQQIIARDSFQPTLPLRGATMNLSRSPLLSMFQPTLPLRGATDGRGDIRLVQPRFNPRSPCGERPCSGAWSSRERGFNPRSPCGERQDMAGCGVVAGEVSTHAPLAGSDRPDAQRVRHERVSTHAPLAGSDSAATLSGTRTSCFNPRSPCGERRR